MPHELLAQIKLDVELAREFVNVTVQQFFLPTKNIHAVNTKFIRAELIQLLL